MTPVRVLVTGADGFVGREVVASLRARGRGVSTLGGADGVDVADGTAVAAAVKDRAPEVIVHLAAVSGAMVRPDEPGIVTAVNAVGTVNVLEAARTSGVQRVVLASSTAVAERAPNRPNAPRSLYGATKQFGDTVAGLYRERYPMTIVSTHLGAVYGRARRTEDTLALMLDEAKRAGVIHWDPEAVEPLIEVRDAGRVLAALATTRDPRAAYDIVSSETPHEVLAELLAQALGVRTARLGRDAPRVASRWVRAFDTRAVFEHTGESDPLPVELGVAEYAATRRRS